MTPTSLGGLTLFIPYQYDPHATRATTPSIARSREKENDRGEELFRFDPSIAKLPFGFYFSNPKQEFSNMISAEDRLKMLRHVVLDMDGTIYLGDELFETTLPFLEVLQGMSIGYSFLTNNNSRSRREYAAHLHSMGVRVQDKQVFSSTDATVEYLSKFLPEIADVFVLGTPGLVEDLNRGGLNVAHGRPDAVIVGFDSTLCYERLAQAAYWIEQGLPYIATHPDLTCPTDLPTVLPDCGAICALLEAATGRRPDAVPGKPSPAMLDGVLRRHQVKPSEAAMVGDRIPTDIQMARDAGALAVLTLTGATTALQAAESPVGPDLIVADLGDLSRQIRAARS